MCEYISRNKLKDKKQEFLSWVKKVQKAIKKEHKIHFNYGPIGSGKRNMVIKQCNTNYFDLDYQIIITRIPKDIDFNKDAKKIKNIFRTTFDKFKPKGFKDCEDSTQALTTKNNYKGYGFDIIIIRYDQNDNFYILYNKKNTNNANNNDYSWMIRSEMEKHREKFKLIEGAEMWNYLRKIYLDKRHKYKDMIEPSKKKSYQILNEAVNETLEYFDMM